MVELNFQPKIDELNRKVKSVSALAGCYDRIISYRDTYYAHTEDGEFVPDDFSIDEYEACSELLNKIKTMIDKI